MELIRFEKVALGYEGQTVVKGLNFEVNKGDYLCILGQNGSGKSTVMKAILGLVSPVEGRILRAKGIVSGENGAWIEFDFVPEEHQVRPGHPDYTGRLCVIGAELKEDKLAELFGL